MEGPVPGNGTGPGMGKGDSMTGETGPGVFGVARIGDGEGDSRRCSAASAARIDAIASRDLGRAREARPSRLGIAQRLGSYEELLADPAIEAIYNPLPNELHVPWTICALEAGKHVLCEKPIALTAEEARRCSTRRARSASWSPRPSWCASTRNGGAPARSRAPARSATLRAIQTFFSYHLLDPANIRNKPPGGGALYDIGCYAILTARHIFGAEPTRVAATLDIDPVMGTDRLVERPRRIPGRAASDLHLRDPDLRRISASPSRASGAGSRSRSPSTRRPTGRRGSVDSGADLFGGGARREDFPICDQYTLQGDAFSRAALGEAPWAYPLEDAIANMQVIDAIFRAGRSGRWETV